MPPEGAVFPVMHAENSIVVLRFRKTFVVAWHGLLLDDILTDVAVVFGGGDHDDIVAGAAADDHVEGAGKCSVVTWTGDCCPGCDISYRDREGE